MLEWATKKQGMSVPDAPFSSPEAKLAYDNLLKQWGEGDQFGAERGFLETAKKHPRDLRLFFFAALLTRSRFDIKGGLRFFDTLAKVAPKTRQGEASRYMAAIDRQQESNKNFSALADLAMKDLPVEPLTVWLYAIAARTLDQNKAGIAAYTLLLKNIKTGSSLVHQTFANLLDEEARSLEALPHRQKAVALEPAPWSYDGLASTLYRLRRTDEALAMRAETQKRYPDFALGWANWATNLAGLDRYKEALEKVEKALQLDPNNPDFRKDRDEYKAKAH